MRSDNMNLLIIDGYSNHDWQQTTSGIRTMLATKLVTANVYTYNEQAGQCPDLSSYDVIIQNYNDAGKGPCWPRSMEKELEAFVSNGGGLFIFHSANNAFADWVEYNRIIGLGWRDAKAGPALIVQDDETVTPISGGDATSHGPRAATLVTSLGNHPIHAGLPKQWMAADLEVYRYARGPAENCTVLSYAHDEASDLNFPIEWTVEYGTGRVYNSTFGHVWADQTAPEGMRCIGFQTIFLRALQWLAKQNIDTSRPSDFPATDAISLRALS